jgi:hypothetical protein
LLQALDEAVEKTKQPKLKAALEPHSQAMLKLIFNDCKLKQQKKIKKLYQPRAKSSTPSLADPAVKDLRLP